MPIVQTQDHSDNPSSGDIGFVPGIGEDPIVPQKSTTVTVNFNGADREFQIVAGQPVPADLVRAYVDQHGDPRKKADKADKAKADKKDD